MTWQVVTVGGLIVSCAYLAIGGIIGLGLVRTGQLRTNRLGTATAAIFLTCGIGHGIHAMHMLVPTLGVADAKALAERASWHWETAAWELVTAVIAVYYLSLRHSYASVMRGAQMFEDLKARERQALEINDNVVQGLAVAKYALETGRDEQTREAIEDTLKKAQTIISGLLGQEAPGMMPGRLRREMPASVTHGPPARAEG